MLEQIFQIKTTSDDSRLLFFSFFSGILILLIVGLCIVLPSAKVTLKVNSEPLSGEFRIKIYQSVEKPIASLDAIGGQVVDYQKNVSEIDGQKYFLIDDLIDTNNKKAFVFLRRDIEQILREKLKNIMPAPKIIIDNNLRMAHKVEEFNWQSGQAVVNFFVQAKAIPDYNLESLKEALVNKPRFEALDYLKALPNVQQDIKIKIWPGFLDRLPAVGKRITIRLDII